MENEIMNFEETGMDTVVDVVENSGMSTGAAMATGASITVAVIAIVKLAKWGIGKIKAKREARLWDDGVTEEDVEDVAE